ncbi:MAG TPA: PepSY domain-containing protein [Candidatus Paceibacterota bacterium]|nr:PepSY domain-containing protein [Candidatus Paceibacterota bacterium]
MKRSVLLSALVVAGMSRLALAGELTAFDLIKEANEYVGKESKNRVVQIRSDKSVGSLTPTIWYIVFFDPDARMKATEVKFGAGKKMDVQRPFRLFERAKADKVFDRAKLKVDSDKAIKIATAEPLLANLSIRATQLWLDSDYKLDLSVGQPVWKVRLWANKFKNPSDSADIGEVFISAETGKVLKSDLHINRVD